MSNISHLQDWEWLHSLGLNPTQKACKSLYLSVTRVKYTTELVVNESYT